MNDTSRKALEEHILGLISPNQTERQSIEETSEELRRKVAAIGDSIMTGLEFMLVGSVAKGTYLNDPDIDVFIIFPAEVPRSELETVGLEIGEKSVGGVRKYAEHPYIHGRFKGFEVDIVPCYRLDVGGKNLSAVDRTPLHTRYMLEHLTAEGKRQVMLLKRFCKGVGCYGADGRVQGFSGYLTELLILRYGSFDGVLSAASKWKQGQRLCIDRPGEGKFSSPLIFYDPVDLRRNVASAVSGDKMGLFCQAAREYLAAPDQKFFFPRPLRQFSTDELEAAMEARGTGLCAIRMPRPDIIDDNLYPQVRRTQEGVVALCCDKGFEVLDSSYSVSDDHITIVIEVASEILSNASLHEGPPALNENSEQFLQRWRAEGISNPFIRDGRWVVLAQREHPHLAEMLRACMGLAAMGSDLRDLKDIKVLDAQEMMTSGMEMAITAHYDKRLPWER
jgi:tRNA nucleotidyltransferase (CCA-adding enzyme)